ncbi:NeuA [Desulforapulum autotrophicum HRM2]|uniref:NeuA n=1 Tax=Desulforapulum autotrophicum (strain ATCC 43914 / DSM 3382 / VKM B-1955 / HRM2) TaxID=177437 RepID=C0QA25_DESAH|nr:pseudaminic acid cytidylyltransferase [Desulforapulum autotrophicum]ACN16743.1 NeuA [Desulforapulum autotrophicum HRM2]
MNIAIIPARGGSKRIPDKNIKSFAGKPIIAYSIEAAKASGVFDKIIVSTDSERIADVAQKYGAEIPFMRPEEISDDHTPTAPVLLHALNKLSKKNIIPDYICCIYATAPFCTHEYIKEGFELISGKKVSSVFSVTTFPFTIFRALKINQTGNLQMFYPEHELTRSNDLPEAYHDAGQFYWLECKTFLKQKELYTEDALPVILPRYRVQDIDTTEDWETAEHMYNALQMSKR